MNLTTRRRQSVSFGLVAGLCVAAALNGCRSVGDDATPAPAAPALASTPGPAPAKTTITFADARPITVALHRQLPAELTNLPLPDLERAWPDWTARHNAAIRQRLERGDEDSVVNFWLYGTSFTSRPRATGRQVAALASRDGAEALLIGRLDDLVAALVSPGANDRLRFARHVIERRGINLATPSGQDQARETLVTLRARMIAEHERYRRVFASASLLDDAAKLAAYADVYRDRGLSSDTSLAADFAVEQALAAIAAKGLVATGTVRRVAIVGPGLDFADKAEGYDFYPQQTIQPFAIVDTLLRLRLATANDLALTTFDVSPRVNQHLDAARERARRGDEYLIHLPLDDDTPARQWTPDLFQYWSGFADRIAAPDVGVASPPGLSGVRVRAVRVRSDVVTAIVPIDLNIVLERLTLPEAERFDLVVATNVLVYYDAFEQGLAVANIAAMLRPGGYFVTNYAVQPRPPFEPAARLTTRVFWDRQGNGDTLLAYRRGTQ